MTLGIAEHVRELLRLLYDWRIANPIKSRQQKLNLSNAQTVSVLGCSSRTYYDWLAGEYVPSDWNDIAKFLELDQAETERRWESWLAARPRL